MKSSSCILRIILLALSGILLLSCSVQIVDRSSLKSYERMRGVYHRVKPGETLWRISKAYNVDLQELAEINNITDASRINAGDAIFIPDAHQVIDLPPVKPPAETKPVVAGSPEKPATARTASVPAQEAGSTAGTTGAVAAAGTRNKVKEESITDRTPAQKQPERSPAAARAPEKPAPAAAEKLAPTTAPSGKTQVAVKSPVPAAPVKAPETTPRERVVAAPPPKKPEPAHKAEEPQGQIKVEKGRFAWPVKGPVITRFGIQPSGMKYNGIKIAAREGTPVHAAAAGTVIYASYVKGYGDTVIVKHDENYTTVYAYLRGSVTKKDDRVKKGEKIASIGSPEEPGGEPFLYFEIREKNKARNPMFFLP